MYLKRRMLEVLTQEYEGPFPSDHISCLYSTHHFINVVAELAP